MRTLWGSSLEGDYMKAEQERIVVRVAELLRQCDALEAQLRETRTLGAHLLDSTLHHLLAA